MLQNCPQPTQQQGAWRQTSLRAVRGAQGTGLVSASPPIHPQISRFRGTRYVTLQVCGLTWKQTGDTVLLNKLALGFVLSHSVHSAPR